MQNTDIYTADDRELKARFGTRDPFKVPDGYFESLTEQVMSSLPAQPKAKTMPLRRKLMRWSIAASVACVMGLAGFLAYDAWQTPQPTDTIEFAYDEDLDEALEYMMVSNDDITSYLTMGE